MLSAPGTALAGLAAYRIPPRTGARHAFVVAFHHLNRGATWTDLRRARGRRANIFK